MKTVSPEKITFERTPGGMLRAVVDGTVLEPVDCVPLFPLSRPERYISVVHQGQDTPKELGVIESLDGFSGQQRALVLDAIALRHFTPVVTDIIDLRCRHGTARWHVITDRGERHFRVRDMKENVELRDSGLLLITDTENCRYQVPDYRTLPQRARRLVEKYLL